MDYSKLSYTSPLRGLRNFDAFKILLQIFLRNAFFTTSWLTFKFLAIPEGELDELFEILPHLRQEMTQTIQGQINFLFYFGILESFHPIKV